MVKWIVPIMLVAAFACERRTQEEGTGTEGAVGAEREPGMQPPAQQQPDQQGQQPGQGQQQPGQQPMGQEQAASEQDRQVMQNIRQALQDADLSETAKKNVQVMAKEGRVTLTGTVASAQEMAELERIVRGVPGVREIDNQVRVGGP